MNKVINFFWDPNIARLPLWIVTISESLHSKVAANSATGEAESFRTFKTSCKVNSLFFLFFRPTNGVHLMDWPSRFQFNSRVFQHVCAFYRPQKAENFITKGRAVCHQGRSIELTRMNLVVSKLASELLNQPLLIQKRAKHTVE